MRSYRTREGNERYRKFFVEFLWSLTLDLFSGDVSHSLDFLHG